MSTSQDDQGSQGSQKFTAAGGNLIVEDEARGIKFIYRVTHMGEPERSLRNFKITAKVVLQEIILFEPYWNEAGLHLVSDVFSPRGVEVSLFLPYPNPNSPFVMITIQRS